MITVSVIRNLAISVGLLYLFFLSHGEPTEVSIALNYFSGDLYEINPGWNITPPWVYISKVDTRPMRVCITSSGRGYKCKLVQFERKAYQEFISVEGFKYYWWANRLSFNIGYSEEYRGVRDILRGHAFGTKKYSFIKIMQE